MVTVEHVARAFTKADRCDRCSAQAHMRAEFPSGAHLLFCAHHGTKYHGALVAAHAQIEND